MAADNQIRLKGHAPDHLGVIEVDGNQLKLLPPEGGFPKFLLLNGQAAQEGPLESDDGQKPSLISTENLNMLVLRRGDRYALRIKDSESPTRTGFRGLHWYAPKREVSRNSEVDSVCATTHREDSDDSGYDAGYARAGTGGIHAGWEDDSTGTGA